MSSIPKCRCGIDSANKEIHWGRNRGRWCWKCAKNLCGFYKLIDPGNSTYTFTTYTIPRKPKHLPFIKSPFSSKQCRLPVLDLGSSTNLSALGSGNDKQSRSRRQTERITVQLALYTSTDISVYAQGRHNLLQTIFNTIPGIAWLEELQLWVFSADQQTYQQVWDLLQQHRAFFEVISVPGVILRWLPKSTQLLQEQLQQNQLSHHNGIENNETLDDLLYDWDMDMDMDMDYDNDDKSKACYDDTDQSAIKDRKMNMEWNLKERIGGSTLWQGMTVEWRSGLKKIIDLDGHVYLQDPGGSGNSLQALGVALVHRDDWPVLIICRASVCQKWNALIQDNLLLEQHQISLLDHVPLSHSPKAAQSRRRRKQEKLKKQKETMAGVSSVDRSSPLATSETSTHVDKIPMEPKDQTTTRNHSRKKGDCWIRILDNSGDAPPSNRHNSDQGTGHVTHTKKPGTFKKKRKLQKGDIYIRLVENSGDYYSDTETAGSDDDDFMDSNDDGTENRILKMATETNINPSNSTLNGTEQSGDTGNNTQQNNQATPGAAHFFIISYDKAITKLGTLSANEYKVIIFDDCHDLNGTVLPTHKASLQDLVNASKKTIMVSDVPILPKPMESFPLLQVLKPSMFVDKKFFGHRYCDAKQIVFGWDYTGSSNSFELEYLLNKTVLVS